MRWFPRTVVLCLLMVMLTPAPAHAWFAWLDHLSGPGRFYGVKVDVRAWCFGRQMPFSALNGYVQEARRILNPPATGQQFTPAEQLTAEQRTAAMKALGSALALIREMDEGLQIVTSREIEAMEQSLR